MIININNYVSFELTEVGLKILKEYNESVIKKGYVKGNYNATKINGEVHSMQLWEVMKVFGKGCYLGSESPFKLCEITVKE